MLIGNYGSDFSVSTRLLSSPVPTNTNNIQYYNGLNQQYSNCSGGPSSWQYMLPSDVGTIRSPHTSGHYTAPNASLSMLQPPPAYFQYEQYRRSYTDVPPLHHKSEYIPSAVTSSGTSSWQFKRVLPSSEHSLSSPSGSYPSTPNLVNKPTAGMLV